MENNDLIVINKHELNSEYVNNRIKEEKESKQDLNKSERIPVQNNIFLNPVFYTAVCGFIAAFFGWGIIEYVSKTEKDSPMMWLLTVVAMGLGFLISSIDALMSGNLAKTARNGAIGLGYGLVLGIASNFIANIFYSILLYIVALSAVSLFPELRTNEPKIVSMILFMIARAPAWALYGAAIGIIPGFVNKSNKLKINGLIGGLIGGFIGGFVFDPVGRLAEMFTDSLQGGLSRGVGFTILGLMIGLFVGLVENMAKDVWIVMKSGPLRGKQFVIYHNPTLIGSSPKSDIYIFKDPNVMPTHAKIQKKGSKYEIIDSSQGKGVYVNSEKINGSKILEKNDTVIVGQSILEFQQKERR
jgi:hypothetical protein